MKYSTHLVKASADNRGEREREREREREGQRVREREKYIYRHILVSWCCLHITASIWFLDRQADREKGHGGDKVGGREGKEERNDGKCRCAAGERVRGEAGDKGLKERLHLALLLWIRDEGMEKKKENPESKSQS